MKRSSMFPGLILIAVGIMLLANNIGLFKFNMSYFWPLFLIIPGLSFEFSYFATGRNPGVLVPGGILITYGILFYLNIFTGWIFMGSLWPFFIFGPAVGLFQLYLFGGRERGVLISSAILAVISLTMLSFTLFGFAAEYIAPLALILLGVFILSKNRNGNEYDDASHNEKYEDPDLEEYYQDTDDE